MKNTINKSSFIILFLIICAAYISCKRKKEVNADNQNTSIAKIMSEVDSVIAIGKVKSENGNYIIASNTSGIIEQLLVKEGDTVKLGQPLIKLYNPTGNIDMDITQAKVSILNDQVKTLKVDLEQQKIQLDYLKRKLASTKLLFEKGAETKDNFLSDETNYQQQQEIVKSLLTQIATAENQVQEQRLEVQKENIVANEYTITSPGSGTISSLDVKIGQYINNSAIVGEVINLDQLIIEAEVDELFADEIRTGQIVTFKNINTKQILGQGTIIYAAPILVNKSILFESANEAEDRRVRKIKIKPSAETKDLFVNAKVECQIKTK